MRRIVVRTANVVRAGAFVAVFPADAWYHADPS